MERSIVASFMFILFLGGMTAFPLQSLSPRSPCLAVVQHPVAMQDIGSGPIPTNLTIIVGDVGNVYEDALAYASAIPLALASNGTHTSAGMLLPDVASGIASPLDDWLNLSNGHINDLVYIGSISAAEHLALAAASHVTHAFTGSTVYQIAADLADEMFPASSSVVICYADTSDVIFENTTLIDTSGSLSPPTTYIVGGTTSSSNDFEYLGTVSPSAGGVIAQLISSDQYLFFDMLARRGSDYYLMDSPWLDSTTVAHPYEEVSGETWVLHVIDMYQYERTMSLSFVVRYPDADVYSVLVSPGEDCRLNINAESVSPARLGVHVLDPDGRIVANGNRYSFLQASQPVTQVTVNLSHPRPGTYRVYVTNGDSSSVSYHLDVSKSVVRPGWDATAASVSNGAAVASLLGAPILYVNKADVPAQIQNYLSSWQGENVYVVDPMNAISQPVIDYLTSLEKDVSVLDDFRAVQQLLADFGQFNATSGSVVLYDNQGTSFVAAALSAAHRHAVALPFSYGDSKVMTTAQVAEQVSWHREYQSPLSSGMSVVGLWGHSPDLTMINPPYSDMHAICDAFFPWLEMHTGITDPGVVMDFSPFYGIGTTMPVAFERAILGKAMPGRYASTNTAATLVQVMRSVLRLPLLSKAGASRGALASYVAYAYGLDVYYNQWYPIHVNNRDEISTMMSQAGLNTAFSAGPTVANSLSASPYLWAFSTHGITGDLMYSDDGIITLMSSDTAAGYEVYGNPDSDGDGIVNPPSSYLDAHEMGDLLNGVNLRGTVALIDSCQIASSYAPSSLMEAGADAVVACWSDSLFGPSDLVERNILYGLSYSDKNFGGALLDALAISSHVYSLDAVGLDHYIGTSEVFLIGASSEQFVLFGDPLVTLTDWQVTCYPMMNRFQSMAYMSDLRAHPGSTCRLPIAQYDLVGHPFAQEGAYSIEVLDPDNLTFSSGYVVATGSSIEYYDIVLPMDAKLGEYTILCTDTSTYEKFVIALVVESPVLTVKSVVVTGASQIGTWQLTVTVTNPHNAVTNALMTVYLGTRPIYTESTYWASGTTSQTFTFDVLLVDAGSQSLTVTLTVEYVTPLSFTGATTVFVSASFAYYGLFLCPVLASATIAVSYVSTKQLRSLKKLQLARRSEIDGHFDEALNSYLSLGLDKSSIRVAARTGFSDETAKLLTARLDVPGLAQSLNESAQSLETRNEFAAAARIFSALGLSEASQRNMLKSMLQTGNFQEASRIVSELAASGSTPILVGIVTDLETSGSTEWALSVVNSAKSDFLKSADLIAKDNTYRDAFQRLIPLTDDKGFQVNMTLRIWGAEAAAARIVETASLEEMVAMTEQLQVTDRPSVATHVVRQMFQSDGASNVADYLLALHFDSKQFPQAVSPLFGRLLRDSKSQVLGRTLNRLKESETEENAQMLARMVETVNAVSALDLTDIGGRTRALLDAANMTESIDIRNVIMEDLLPFVFNDRPVDQVPASDIAAFTQEARALSYEQSPQRSSQIRDKILPFEESLLKDFTARARSQLIGMEFNPESYDEVAQTIKALSHRIRQAMLDSNPSVMIQALSNLLRESGFPSSIVESGVVIRQEAAQRFVDRTLADPIAKQEVLSRCRVFVPSGQPGYGFVTTDRMKLAEVLNDRANQVWIRGLRELWVSALWDVMSEVVHDSTAGSLHPSQKTELIVDYLTMAQVLKTFQNLQAVEDEFVKLCDVAGLDDSHRLKVAEGAGLPERVKQELRKRANGTSRDTA